MDVATRSRLASSSRNEQCKLCEKYQSTKYEDPDGKFVQNYGKGLSSMWNRWRRSDKMMKLNDQTGLFD